jgi:hypothetical protein
MTDNKLLHQMEKISTIRGISSKHSKNFYNPKGKTSKPIDYTTQYLKTLTA